MENEDEDEDKGVSSRQNGCAILYISDVRCKGNFMKNMKIAYSLNDFILGGS